MSGQRGPPLRARFEVLDGQTTGVVRHQPQPNPVVADIDVWMVSSFLAHSPTRFTNATLLQKNPRT